mmetsp:Transcript_6515/g.830  ORF Transcript_6515/g.830 Transcript_6515/m.830 type:complete len:105 (+) Transcript_6515:709-1023(+)
MNNPGPGTYDADLNVNNRQAPAYRIGTASRSNENRLKHKTTPGPGAHNFNVKCHCGNDMWTFGKDLRSKDKDDGEPGPGYYDIPPTVPDVPPYLLKSKKETLFS